MDEGYIKFTSDLLEAPAPDTIYTSKLDDWRKRLHDLSLIGEYPNGIGFGNLSRRFNSRSFIISASGTGGKVDLTPEDYVLVTEFDIRTNYLASKGQHHPSSESLTHGVIYNTLPDVRCIMHVHDAKLWTAYKNILPTTAEHIPYGTPEMAKEVKRMITSFSPRSAQVIVMGGHEEGVIVFGRSVDITGQRLIKLVNA